MNKKLFKYLLVVTSITVLAMVSNVIFLDNMLQQGRNDPNTTLQTIFSPYNFIILSTLGCFLHWYFIGRKELKVVPLSGQAAMGLGIIATSAMIGFLLGTVGFFIIVLKAMENEPLLGLFIFVLPGVSISCAVIGALLGLGIVLLRKRKTH